MLNKQITPSPIKRLVGQSLTKRKLSIFRIKTKKNSFKKVRQRTVMSYNNSIQLDKSQVNSPSSVVRPLTSENSHQHTPFLSR